MKRRFTARHAVGEPPFYKAAYFTVLFFLPRTTVLAAAPQLTDNSMIQRIRLLVSPVFGLVVSPVPGLLSLGVVVAESNFQVAS